MAPDGPGVAPVAPGALSETGERVAYSEQGPPGRGIWPSSYTLPVSWYLIGYVEDEGWNLADCWSVPGPVLA
jgi:hypothetical protein